MELRRDRDRLAGERIDTTHPIYGGRIAYFSKPEIVQMVAEMRHDFDELMIHEATSD